MARGWYRAADFLGTRNWMGRYYGFIGKKE